MKKPLIEQKVAETIGQRPLEIKVGRKTYLVPHLTFGTMVLISEEIAKGTPIDVKPKTALVDVLRGAKNSRYLADVIAIAILGSKRLRFNFRNTCLNILSSIRNLSLKSPKKRLAIEIFDNCTNEQLDDIYAQILSAIDVNHFFDIITFLNEIQITKPTKVIKTTASGQS